LWAAIHALTKGPHVRDGNPRAQARLEAKVKRLGALKINLTPGKRGRYKLKIYSFAGWDPQRDAGIRLGDPIPEKPWMGVILYVVRGKGQGRVIYNSFPPILLFLTHHCLSRSAQRWGVRTVADLSAAISSITAVALEYLIKRSRAEERGTWFDTPPEGVRLPMPRSAELGGKDVIVVEKHETRQALVVSTVLRAALRN
jgi:hypothetical protein